MRRAAGCVAYKQAGLDLQCNEHITSLPGHHIDCIGYVRKEVFDFVMLFFERFNDLV